MPPNWEGLLTQDEVAAETDHFVQFLASSTTKRVAVQDFHAFAGARPRYEGPEAPPLCEDGQIAERLRLAAELQEWMRGHDGPGQRDYYQNFTLTQVHLSMILCSDVGALRALIGMRPTILADDLIASESLLAACKTPKSLPKYPSLGYILFLLTEPGSSCAESNFPREQCYNNSQKKTRPGRPGRRL